MKDFGQMLISRKGKEDEKYEIEYGNISFKPSIDLFLLGVINNESDMSILELEDKFNIILSIDTDSDNIDYRNINPHECGVYTFEFVTTIGDKFCNCKIDDAWITGFANVKEMILKTRANSKLIINELK